MSAYKAATLGLICLLIIGAAAYAIFRVYDGKPKAHSIAAYVVRVKPLPHPTIGPVSQPPAKSVTLLFDKYGFEPNQFQVPIGVTIDVVNASSSPFVFSALPGQADQLSALDLGSIAVGASKSFSIDRLGNWQFEANGSPALRGEVSSLPADSNWSGLSADQMPKYDPASKSLLINYTDYGFVPNIASVPLGTKVTIKNSTDEGGMSFDEVSSDSSPNPVLNLGVLNMGQSKSFVLNTKGSWKYINTWEVTDLGQITAL